MLTDCDPLTGAMWIILPLLLTAVLNLTHAAVVYLDDSQLQNRAAAGDKNAAGIVRLLSKNDRAKVVVQMTSYVSAAVATQGVVSLGLTSAARTAAFFLTPVLFAALAVYSPRRIAAYYPDDIAASCFGFLKVWCVILSPLAAVVRAISSVAVRLSGGDPREEPSQVTEEEIRMLVDEGEESGVIDEDEKKMINSIFEFDDRDVSEVMTHRTEVNAVPVTATLFEAVDAAMQTGHSRLPVYEEDIDSVCGILYAKDLLKFLGNPEQFSMRKNMREPLYVPEAGSCADVFALMQKEKTQIAVVVDEYGGTYGIVTMEDLLETIFGSIQDEYDDEKPEVERLGENTYLIDAAMGLGDAQELLDLRFPDDSEADTIGGYLTEQIGFVPPAGDKSPVIRVGAVSLSAQASDDRRIITVLAVRDDEPDEEEEE